MTYCLTWSIYFMQIFKFSTPIEALQRDSNERSLGAHFDCLLAPLRRLLASPVADEKVKKAGVSFVVTVIRLILAHDNAIVCLPFVLATLV